MNKDENKDFLNNLFRFLDSDSGETLEELKEELKEEGVDFFNAETKLKETFSQLLKKRKAEIDGEERKRMLKERAEYEQFRKFQDLPKDRKSRLEEINKIISENPDWELKLASRNYENITFEDSGKILIELRALINKGKSNE